MKKSLLLFLALLLVCGAALGGVALLTEKPIAAAEAALTKRTLKELYPQGHTWEKPNAPEGALELFVCEEKGNTPVYVFFLPLDEGKIALAVKGDGTVLGTKSLSPRFSKDHTKKTEEAITFALAAVEEIEEERT